MDDVALNFHEPCDEAPSFLCRSVGVGLGHGPAPAYVVRAFGGSAGDSNPRMGPDLAAVPRTAAAALPCVRRKKDPLAPVRLRCPPMEH